MVIQHSHLQDMLLHSGPLVLAHHLLNVELLPFGCISTEDCELMFLEGHPRLQMPPFGHLTIHSSPRVTLVHLAANAISLGLRITRQEVFQLLIDFGNCLVMSLLEILEQLLDLLNLHLEGRDVHVR